MELRVFAKQSDAREAFDRERGVGHFFARMEVLKQDGTRVRFVSMESLRNVEYLVGFRFTKIEFADPIPENRKHFFLALTKNASAVQQPES